MGRLGSNGKPILSDLRDSGSIEQDADLVLFVDRPGMYGLDDSPEAYTHAEIIIAKNRAGKLGTIQMTFNGDQTRFIDIANSLETYTPKGAPQKPKMDPSDNSAWNQANGIVGGYDPFEHKSSYDYQGPFN